MSLAIFSIAAAIGAVMRFEFERLSAQKLGERFPYGTLFANVIGSFILGYSLSEPTWSMEMTLFVSSFCGAFTTFGGFIGQTQQRFRHRSERHVAMIYLFLTIGLSLFSAWLGLTS